jgi:hypothetical protein
MDTRFLIWATLVLVVHIIFCMLGLPEGLLACALLSVQRCSIVDSVT